MEQDPLAALDIRWYRTPFFERLIVLALPPLGLWLAWKNPERGRFGKVLVTLFTVLWMVPYLAGILGLGAAAGWVAIEWEGGFGPSLVRRKTEPNYTQLEQHRRERRLDEPVDQVPTNQVSKVEPYWTDFRGPRRDGHYTERPVLTEWPFEGPKRLWRQPCGGGYASFVVARGLAYTIEQRREQEAVVAYDLDTGREVWVHRYEAHFSEWMGGDGPRATPTYREGFVYSLGAEGQLCCLSAGRGTVLWHRDVLADTGAANLRYGLACSPIVAGKSIIVLSGEAASDQAVVAYDYLTGKRLWSALSDKMSYTSPLFAEIGGRPQLVIVSARRVLGLDLEERKVLWDYPWQVSYDNAIAMPVLVSSNRLMISAGYGVGSALLEVAAAGDAFPATEVWRNRNLKNKFNASVYWQDHLYGLDEGVLCCVNVKTGERVWRDGRYGYGQLLLANGYLIVLGGEGQLALVEATPKGFVEKHAIQAIEGKTWNVPALAHGRLLLRNGFEMTCFDLRRRRNDTLTE